MAWWPVDAAISALADTGWQLACILGPLAACAVVLHQLQRMLAAALATTFGWRAMLLTGWLGVPVHELAHVAACLAFMHELEEVKLFAPDPETGSLGLVRHRAPPGNPWAAIGRLFIAVAPLGGGALALWLAAHLLLPDIDLLAGPLAAVGPEHAHGRAWALVVALLDPARLTDPRAWLFLYVATCIGAHLAPSAADLRDASRGGVALLAALFVVNLVARAFGGAPPGLVASAAALTTPAVALMSVAAIICALVLGVVLVVTACVERARGGHGHLRRFAQANWLRLAVAAGTAATFVLAALPLGELL